MLVMEYPEDRNEIQLPPCFMGLVFSVPYLNCLMKARIMYCWLVPLAMGLLLVLSTDAVADRYPRLLWSVADDALAIPLGAIEDVAVGADGIVYLLDMQNQTVRRFARNGVELPSLGRHGEGPGEFIHPRLVAALPSGGCMVIQDFHAPAICISSNGHPCDGPDVSLIRAKFAMTIFLGVARVDAKGRLYVSAATTPEFLDPMTPNTKIVTNWSVFRLAPGELAPTILFSDSRELDDETSVHLPKRANFFAVRSWDVSAVGQVAYADPQGLHRVIVGHPKDGPSRAIDLPEAQTDRRDLEILANRAGVSIDQIPRIADVQWVNDDVLLAVPLACARSHQEVLPSVVELFDSKGNGFERRAVQFDYDPSRDSLFLRSGILVTVRGGKSAMETALHLRPQEQHGDVSDVIVVSAYSLSTQPDMR
jgi:hypothetical protein